jgi:hypothetical protein
MADTISGGSPGAETLPPTRIIERARQEFRALSNGDDTWRMHADVRPDDSDEIFKALADLAASQSSTLASLRQQLADAELTARYQSDVARQADEAREKAEHERDAVIATAADTIFTTTQTWVEKMSSLQAENADLKARIAAMWQGYQPSGPQERP